jgi:hypothetical protein
MFSVTRAVFRLPGMGTMVGDFASSQASAICPGVELQRPGHRVQHRLRRAGEAAALEPGVVVDTQPGEHGDLLTPQALHPPLAPVGAQPGLLRADPGPAAGQEVLDVSAVIHDSDARTRLGDEPGPVSTWISRSSPRTNADWFSERGTHIKA